jgi:hypothetical protein
MIICPWCGTNYIAFQSTCSKCGGPVQAPKTVASPEREDEVPMPPPPPRDISDGYRWRIMLADSWSIAAGIIALIGAIFSLAGLVLTVAIITAFVGLPFLGMGLLFLGGGGYVLYWRYNEALKAMNILRNGEAVPGQVTGAQTNHNVAVNGRNPLTIGYQFQVDGKDYQSTVTTLNHLNLQFEAGKPVCVLYLPNAPEYSSLYPHP